jgi:predicted nucleotidyltransferase
MDKPGDKEEIIRKMRDVLPAIPSLRLAYVYGSFLSREDFRDIDIALLADDRYDQDSFDEYASEAGNRLEESLDFRCECDVRTLNNLPVWLKFEIISTGKLLYVRNEDDRIDFETQVLVEYQDMKSLYDLFDREYLAQA